MKEQIKYNTLEDGLIPSCSAIKPNYYNSYKITPIEFILANNIPFCEANAIKYLCRWRSKNGVEDLKKCKEYIDILIKNEEK